MLVMLHARFSHVDASQSQLGRGDATSSAPVGAVSKMAIAEKVIRADFWFTSRSEGFPSSLFGLCVDFREILMCRSSPLYTPDYHRPRIRPPYNSYLCRQVAAGC
jgi:hypothetical protein